MLPDIAALEDAAALDDVDGIMDSAMESEDIPTLVQLREIPEGASTTEYESVTIPDSAVAESCRRLVKEFSKVFTTQLPQGGARVDEFELELMEGKKLPADVPRRTSPAIQAMVREEVTKLMEAGIVRESCGPVASPIVVVKQKGKHRLCVDYRVLNDATSPLKFPLPNLMGILERLVKKR